jgi:hypothetical protein
LSYGRIEIILAKTNPLVLIRRSMGSAKDTQTMLRHTKPDTAQINYVQPVEDSVRSAVDKLAATLLG